MNKLKAVVCVMLLLASSIAHAAVTYIGTCEGKLSAVGESKTGSGTISVAVIVPQSEYYGIDGSQITGMRIGILTTEGISNVKVWMRRELTGENIAEAAIEKVRVGWNEVTFAAPIPLHATDNLVLGYDFDQESSVKCISVAGSSQPDGYWVAKNGSWQNRSAQVSGSASIEARAEGENIPDLNLAVESCTYDKITPYGDTFNAKVVVRNMAEKRINGYTYSIDVDGANKMEYTSNMVLKSNDRDTIKVALNSSIVAEGTLIPVNVRIAAEGDGSALDDVAVLRMSTYHETVPHKVLVEEFSTEQCPNCPRAHNTIKNCLDAGLGTQMVLVTHHVGYKKDWLTVEEDKAYEWFYGDDGTFAPAGMFDRTNLPEYHAVNSTSDDKSVPVFSIGLVDTFRPALEFAMSQPSFVTIVPKVDYNESTRELSVSIDCEKLSTLDALTSNPRLTVYLIEDSILAHDQAGVSSTTYRHRHVYRKCLTDIWGDAVAFGSDNTVSAQYTYTIPEDWDDNYVEAVAFISNYNSNDRNDCCVFNAEHIAIKSTHTAIQTVRTKPNTPTCYNLLGQKVAPSTKGIKIINGRTVAN